MRTFKLLFFGLAGAGALACGSHGGPEDDVGPRSGLQLSTKIQFSDDVRGFDYTVTRVACEGEAGDAFDPATYTASISPQDLLLPNGLPAFEKAPADPDSAHMFADHYFVLPAGCYDVLATPTDEQGATSEVCYPAREDGVQVEDGLTTEIFMISQCIGPARGGLDVVTAVNNPPVVEDLEFRPSKFVSSCDGVEICLTASDPDHDPIEFAWEQISGPALRSGPTVTSTDLLSDGSIQQCVLVQPGEVDRYELKVSVYDLAWNEAGEMARIEDLLSDQDPARPSHDDLIFPLYATEECPAEEPEAGRGVVFMLAMSNEPGLAEADARALAKNAVDWVDGRDEGDLGASILVVRDDAHGGENPEDAQFVMDQLIAAGFTDVDFLDEPADGLSESDVQDYAVVWFSNPGFPMDDALTQTTLLAYRSQGGGLILQGDDMSHFLGTPELMEPLTFLEFQNNGTQTCGEVTDNNEGENYDVALNTAPHPVINGVEGLTFEYGNDIDHSTPLGQGEQVLAWATFQTEVDDDDDGKKRWKKNKRWGDKDDDDDEEACSVQTPAIIAIDPDDLAPM